MKRASAARLGAASPASVVTSHRPTASRQRTSAGRAAPARTLQTAYLFGEAPAAGAPARVGCGPGFAAPAAGVAAEDGDAPGATGSRPPSMFGSLSMLSASLLATAASLIALRTSACSRIAFR